jgi:hypothetical protein
MPGPASQLGLFGHSHDVSLPLKKALAAALKGCGQSRDQVVDRLNQALASEGINQTITPNVLDKWAAPSARHEIPLKMLPFFCEVTGSLEPMWVLASGVGAILAGPREQELMRLGESQVRARDAARLRRRALEALEDMK